jgi:transketolase
LLYSSKEISEKVIPEELGVNVGSSTTIRAVLGSSLGYLNKLTDGAFLGVAADLLGSTSVNLLDAGFPEGFFDAVDNSGSRILSIGGICEDAMGGMMAGLAAYGKNIGVSSSYGAFISAMEHTAARLHGIGEQNKTVHFGGNFNTWILINAHAGLKTGEDGPTHADPQCLQLLQGNFPKGILITLTPWEPGEVWSSLIAGLKKRPAVLSPFVTRPNEIVADRKAMNLAPASDAAKGVYLLRKAKADQKVDATFILQESGVTIEFITKVLPKLDSEGINVNVYYITSSELFDLLTDKEKEKIYPYETGNEIMGITGFTLPTMYQWVTSSDSRSRILHPFKKGFYLGSGNAESVMHEAGLDGECIYKDVKLYLDYLTKKKPSHF